MPKTKHSAPLLGRNCKAICWLQSAPLHLLRIRERTDEVGNTVYMLQNIMKIRKYNVGYTTSAFLGDSDRKCTHSVAVLMPSTSGYQWQVEIRSEQSRTQSVRPVLIRPVISRPNVQVRKIKLKKKEKKKERRKGEPPPLQFNTDTSGLTTGIRSEKCVIRRFRRCANMYLQKPR